jgi:FtsP/CotA-like multicopper oxidase with cupredoxin domain
MKKSKLLILLSSAWLAVVLTGGPDLAHGGPGGGTYFANSPAGGVTGKALRKFVDSLPGVGPTNVNNLGQYIPVAQKLTPPPGVPTDGDYYEIGIVEYAEKMHSDLPKATRLRGYRDLGGNQPAHYLGPLILAQRDRPVRVKFTNLLPTGTQGNLFIPVDTTLMGAGQGPLAADGVTPCDPLAPGAKCASFADTRTAVHLHGGFTPWISDGTPHQWFTPATETTPFKTGVSFRSVPDMTQPAAGSATHFYSNQQSNRLMFYHDHALGTTRLNVYAGMAAGYLIVDPVEEFLINWGILPNAGGLHRYGIPLIIQDKTFVPQNIATQDAKWDTNKWGKYGDFWFPHVYEPNQNPNSQDGANPFGRWDYGPWFWPVFPAKTPLPEPSAVPEAFMDTPVINGTAYPFLQVEPKAYRFRILNACNDRNISLGLYYADPASPTEVKMVPAVPGLPPNWPTDGRDGGVPDPATAGPPIIQIGTEGGFLPGPVVIPSTPMGYEYNRRSVTVLNVFTHGLWLGPAERADIIIDFSSIPTGSTIILYNDGPAPVPGFDPRWDYYSENPDYTSTGGAPTTLAGFGPNTRTIMQFRVVGNPSPAYNLEALQTQLPAAFVASQPPPIVPQMDFPAPYNAPDNTYARIQDNFLTFTPYGASQAVTMPLKPKAIQELFDEYGRMNATLGVERKFTGQLIQTTIPYKYIDPVTEDAFESEPQLWKITHNGVDTHSIHFHLVNVQIINRIGWDGAIKPPEPNELGWKETVRMNPLEDIVVALRPNAPLLPFPVPTSNRLLDPSNLPGTSTQFTGVDVNGNPITVYNTMTNFGWEYVWHCHLLGHEENDMMRPLVMNPQTSPPAAPTNLTAGLLYPYRVNLAWQDNAVNESGFRVQRTNVATNATEVFIVPDVDAPKFSDWSAQPSTTYKYQVWAYNSATVSGPSTEITITTPPKPMIYFPLMLN